MRVCTPTGHSPPPVVPTRRATLLLLGAVVLAILATGAYCLMLERVVFGGADGVKARHARLHDVGGAILVAIQIPLSTVVAALLFQYLRRPPWPGRVRALLAAPPRRWLLGAVAAGVLVNLVWFCAFLKGGASVEDDHTYLFQATLLSQGRLALPWPWEGFDDAFEWAWTTPDQGRYLSFQMPGHCFLLALGVLLSAPWIVPVVAGGIMAAVTHCAAREMFGRGTAILSSLLIVTSPYVLTTHSSYSLSTSSAMCVALVLLTGARVWRRPTAPRSAALGLSIALLWFVRPPTAVACALPIFLSMVCSCFSGSRRSGRRLLIVAAVALAGLSPYFLYCRAATGGWSFSPGGVYSGRLLSSEISLDNLLSAKGHDAIPVPNLLAMAARLNCYLFGWPLSLAPLAVLVLRRKWRGPNGWLLAACALLLGFYCVSEKFLGWYAYELMPCLAILGARGLLELRRWSRERFRGRPAVASSILTAGLASCLASAVVTMPITMARQAAFVREWMAPVRWIERQISDGEALVVFDPAATESATRQALLGTNDPDLSRRIIHARADDDAGAEELARRRFPARTPYRYHRDRRSGHQTIEKLSAPSAP